MLFAIRWAYFLFHIRMCWLKENKNWLILESVSEEALRKHNEEHVVNMDILMQVVKRVHARNEERNMDTFKSS